ncbi:hypothetical protein PUN28_017362 [Cardiocondyla obscurior]|uniref:Uncharacterized protein n=1 Tax=Cardiocondyla obscurior TaxID=286306 RepID=A0AAW2EQQ4_9HYME
MSIPRIYDTPLLGTVEVEQEARVSRFYPATMTKTARRYGYARGKRKTKEEDKTRRIISARVRSSTFDILRNLQRHKIIFPH